MPCQNSRGSSTKNAGVLRAEVENHVQFRVSVDVFQCPLDGHCRIRPKPDGRRIDRSGVEGGRGQNRNRYNALAAGLTLLGNSPGLMSIVTGIVKGKVPGNTPDKDPVVVPGGPL